MVRYSKVYRRRWALARNPFPDHAIASAGDTRHPFYEGLHPGIGSKMARAFLGTNGAPPDVAFLWSLGQGEEARGYGKTRHLLWFADRVNRDMGRSVARLGGRSSQRERSVATYAAFNSVEGLSLSNLLFDVVRDLLGVRKEILVGLRDAAFANGRSPADLFASAEWLLEKSRERYSAPLLYRLCYGGATDWVEYLDNRYEFSQWHKVRYGRELLRSSVAFVRQLGIDRLVVLVDQVEDFARFTTPLYKLRRDFPRLAYLCSADALLRHRLTFVMTMHPNAARILSRYWPDEDLGSIDVDGNPANVVRIRAMARGPFIEMVKAYLHSARLDGRVNTLAPFTESALAFVHEAEHGRPGYCLQRLFVLLDSAAREGVQTVDRPFAESYFAGQRQAGTGE
jgi:hypothetical protein